MGPSERSHQHGPPLLGRVQVGTRSPASSLVCSQAADSLIPIGLGSGRPLPSAYPGARATRSHEGLPGVRAVLFQRAVVVDPAGCGALLAHGAGPAVAFRLHEALGTQEDVVSRLQGLRPTRSRTYASATALPRSPQGSLPAWVGWPLTGRGSHPLDDTQGFMTYSSIPLDRPAWPHHATTPRRDGAPCAGCGRGVGLGGLGPASRPSSGDLGRHPGRAVSGYRRPQARSRDPVPGGPRILTRWCVARGGGPVRCARRPRRPCGAADGLVPAAPAAPDTRRVGPRRRAVPARG